MSFGLDFLYCSLVVLFVGCLVGFWLSFLVVLVGFVFLSFVGFRGLVFWLSFWFFFWFLEFVVALFLDCICFVSLIGVGVRGLM